MNVNLAGFGRDGLIFEEGETAAALMQMVEDRLDAITVSEVEVASDISTKLFSAGGKRIRPKLVILSALACGGRDYTRMVDLAAAAELIHTASLVHDDVIDETIERRGVATANARWGNKLSVLGGDFLLSKAFSLISGIGDHEILRVLSANAVRMSEAEMLQVMCEGNLKLWDANYWRIVEGKTASFMSACCECGAILAGADGLTRAMLAGYGNQLGMAFQITDDLLDILGDPSVTGKAIGTDIINGKFTLPLLLAAKNENMADQCRKLLSESKDNGGLSPDGLETIVRLIVESGAAEEARRTALDCARSACDRLSGIPSSSYTDALCDLAMSIASREY